MFYSDARLESVVRGCDSTCKAKIRAPALAVTACTTHVIPVNYSDAVPLRQYAFGEIAPPLDQNAFLIALSLTQDQSEKLNLVTGYATTSDCAGTFNYTACTLESAIGEYDISVTNNAATLDSPANPTIIALANDTQINSTYDPIIQSYRSTLGGILAYHLDSWSSQVVLNQVRGQISGTTYAQRVYDQYVLETSGDCPSFADPMYDSIASIKKLMVYAGALAAREHISWLEPRMDPNLVDAINSTITGYLVGDQNVFHADYRFFIAAVLVELVCIALVVPTYWGWWKLGRPVSFSPLEIAKV